MKPMPSNAVDPSDITEVSDFIESDAMLRSFVEQHANIFNQFWELAADYNQKLQAAEKAVRSRGVSCGPFVRFSQMVKDDWQAFYTYCNGDKDEFMKGGVGKIKRITKYEGDSKALTIRIETGEIPEEDVGIFRSVSPRYKKPDPISIPWSS